MTFRTGMKKTPESSPVNLSACALPSHVAIDLSKTKVRKSEEEWRQALTPLQYRVTREQGTEPPFRNEYWDHHVDGMYFSSCSDTPLSPETLKSRARPAACRASMLRTATVLARG